MEVKMSKKVYKIFLNPFEKQENWLNQMASTGWELIKTSRWAYEFQDCKPGDFCYKVDFVADKSWEDLVAYQAFLEELGMTAFSKNMNIGKYSIGEVRFRPFGKGLGKVATSPGTINKELLIVKKKNDGKEFRLHTDYNDLISYMKTIRDAYIVASVLLTVALMMNLGHYLLLNLLLAGVILYLLKLVHSFNRELKAYKRQQKLKES